MNLEDPRKDLSSVVLSLLEKAATQKGLGVLGNDSEARKARLLQIDANEKGTFLHIASDGLTLEDKELVEKVLLHDLRELGIEVRINFKRLKGLGARVQGASASPQVQANPQGPFGIKWKQKAIPGVSKVVAVSSGKGGVGKSTVSVNLAVGLANQGYRVGLLDADLYGPSAPLLMGIDGVMPVTPEQRMKPLEKYGVKVVSFGFMSDPYHPVIWRGPMIAKALEQLFYQTEWGELDYLVIDLPPGTGDVQLTMIENLPLYQGIVVSTPQAVALLDAHKGLSMFEKLNVPVLGLVENMSHFQCGSCGHFEDIFGQAQIEAFAEERRVNIIARIPLSRRIREASDQGVPVILHDPAHAQYYLEIVEKLLLLEMSGKTTHDQNCVGEGAEI